MPRHTKYVPQLSQLYHDASPAMVGHPPLQPHINTRLAVSRTIHTLHRSSTHPALHGLSTSTYISQTSYTSHPFSLTSSLCFSLSPASFYHWHFHQSTTSLRHTATHSALTDMPLAASISCSAPFQRSRPLSLLSHCQRPLTCPSTLPLLCVLLRVGLWLRLA